MDQSAHFTVQVLKLGSAHLLKGKQMLSSTRPPKNKMSLAALLRSFPRDIGKVTPSGPPSDKEKGRKKLGMVYSSGSMPDENALPRYSQTAANGGRSIKRIYKQTIQACCGW